MKVVDIITMGVELLNLESAKTALSTLSQEDESSVLLNIEIASMMKMMNFSIKELCSNYIPIKSTGTFQSTNKKIALSNLTNFIRIENVFNLYGQIVDYKVVGNEIQFEENGKYVVEYLSYPTATSLFDDILNSSKISIDLVVFGMCAYYCLSQARFDEFDIFHGKYIDKAEKYKGRKSVHLPHRRWE